MNCVLNLAPTGMIPTKAMTPFVPVSVSEIVEQVLAAAEIGITMVHLHARDEATGEPTYRAEMYGEIIAGIRRYYPELVICVSLSGRNYSEFEKRAHVLSLDGEMKPDMGSLTLSSLNFNKQASMNAPDMVQALALEMKKRDILPEMEAFDAGMINYASYLEGKGILEPPHYFNLILGNIACAQADLLHIGVMVRDLPPDSLWSLGGVGEAQLITNSIAIATGGGVRVGIEDNLWFDKQRTQLATNTALVSRIHRIVEANDRHIMTPAELRSRLHLEDGNGSYGRIYRSQVAI